jgi:hypothetical protein
MNRMTGAAAEPLVKLAGGQKRFEQMRFSDILRA